MFLNTVNLIKFSNPSLLRRFLTSSNLLAKLNSRTKFSIKGCQHGNTKPRKFKVMSSSTWTPQGAVPIHIKKLLEPTSPNVKTNYILAFLSIVRLLKTQKRQGWVDHKIPKPSVESIADHMYRMSILALIIPNQEINKDKCVKIAIVHDLAESLVGDFTPHDPITKEEKHEREYSTIIYLSTLIKPYNPEAAQEILELWLEYEEIRSIEAQYVKDIDKLELLQQAWDYEQQYGFGNNLEEFYNSRFNIKTSEIQELADEIWRHRSDFKKSLTQEDESKLKVEPAVNTNVSSQQ